MKEDDTPVSSGRAAIPTVHDDYADEDVLRSVPLPGWSIFDALFISWHDHPEAETSGRAFTDTPIARIQKYRRRFIIIVGALLLLSAINRLWSYESRTPIEATTLNQQDNRPSSHLSSLFGWRASSSRQSPNTAPLAGYPLPPSYYAALYNASTTPARLEPSQGRMTMLQAIAKSRSSAYNPADFIVNHQEILSHVRAGGDPLDLISQQASSSDPIPNLRPHAVTAIIVHSPDYEISSTQLIVSMAAKYPFVREIIVWNNDLGSYVNQNTLQLPSTEDLGFLPPSLRVINSPSSFAPLSSPIHRRLPTSRAKHLACGLATRGVCLFLSSSLLPIHLDSLYTSFLSTAPISSQIVSIVNAGDYYHLSYIRFENDDVDLHAGLLRSGISKTARSENARDAETQETIVRREWSRRFMHQLETLTPEVYGEESDTYFSLWMNTFPKLLTAPALAIHDEDPPRPVQATATQLQTARDIVALDAVRSLYSTLSAQDPFLSPDPFPIAPSPPLDDARAPCHDDRCIFETNITPFTRKFSSLTFQKSNARAQNLKAGTKDASRPDPVGVKKEQTRSNRKSSSSAFKPSEHIQSMDEYRAAWHDSSDPSIVGHFPASVTEFQRTSNWYLAVNGRHPSLKTLVNNSTSCWTTLNNLEKGSYFGLNILGSKPMRSIKIIGSANLGNIVGRGQEDLTAESWEVWTKQDEIDQETDLNAGKAKGDWSRRALSGKVESVKIGDSTLYTHTFALAPAASYESVTQPGTGEVDEDTTRSNRLNPEENEDESDGDDQILRKRAPGTVEADEDIPENGEGFGSKTPRALEPMDVEALLANEPITGIRFISRDRKSQPIRFCGFDIDGWVI